MANTITFELNKSEVKKFEKILDEFNGSMSRIKANESERESEMLRLKTESHLLLSQIKEEIKQIKHLRAKSRKMTWEL